MKVIVLGGDGYLGWPQSCFLAARGHDVLAVDNFNRRKYHLELGSDSLTPIQSMEQRIESWTGGGGKAIDFAFGDICDWDFIKSLIKDFAPDAIVHYGELPSAPYSMIDRNHAVFSQHNNVVGTLNVLWAIKEFVPDCHLVKLGTLGEYGTPNIDIEEGYFEIEHKGRKDTLPFPKQPPSFYHLSKVHDSNNIMFACKIWGLKATDLNQGVVYGIETEETSGNQELITRFDYDGVFGTALNRFCVQAVHGMPLTVYGKGGQKRGFINIRDTMRCIEIALENPPEGGKMRVFNQCTEWFSIQEMANKVKEAAKQLSIDVEIQNIENPRVEAAEHYFNPIHTKLESLGLEPHLLDKTLVESMLKIIKSYKDNVREEYILPKVKWGR